MPRYHFAVLNTSSRHEDQEGTVLPDDAAAREYAIRVIGELRRGEEITGKAGCWRSHRASALCGNCRSKPSSRTCRQAEGAMEHLVGLRAVDSSTSLSAD